MCSSKLMSLDSIDACTGVLSSVEHHQNREHQQQATGHIAQQTQILRRLSGSVIVPWTRRRLALFSPNHKPDDQETQSRQNKTELRKHAAANSRRIELNW